MIPVTVTIKTFFGEDGLTYDASQLHFAFECGVGVFRWFSGGEPRQREKCRVALSHRVTMDRSQRVPAGVSGGQCARSFF